MKNNTSLALMAVIAVLSTLYAVPLVVNAAVFPVESKPTITEILRPNEQGYKQWHNIGCASNSEWECVDETSPDTSDRVQADNVNKAESFKFSDVEETQNIVVNKITLSFYGTRFSSSRRCFTPVIVSANTIFNGLQKCFGSQYSSVQQIYTNNPATNQPWTLAEVNNLEAGMRTKTALKQGARIAQMFATVEYTIVIKNNPPDLTEIVGPTSAVNTGVVTTYQFSLYDPDNDTLSYEINWGDTLITKKNGITQSKEQVAVSEDHSWSQPGVYTIAVTIDDGRGMSAEKTLAVNVAGIPDIALVGVYYSTNDASSCVDCDINQDGFITPTDAGFIINRKNFCVGSTNYDAKADLNKDNCVDNVDETLVAGNLGKKIIANVTSGTAVNLTAVVKNIGTAQYKGLQFAYDAPVCTNDISLPGGYTMDSNFVLDPGAVATLDYGLVTFPKAGECTFEFITHPSGLPDEPNLSNNTITKNIIIVPPPFIAISGRLIDASTQNPVPNVQIYATNESNQVVPLASTGSNGEFSFTTDSDVSVERTYNYWPKNFMQGVIVLAKRADDIVATVDVSGSIDDIEVKMNNANEINLSSIPLWPSVDIELNSYKDVPINFDIRYSEGQGESGSFGNTIHKIYHILSNVIPLGREVVISVRDEQGNTHTANATSLPFSNGASPLFAYFYDGYFTFGVPPSLPLFDFNNNNKIDSDDADFLGEVVAQLRLCPASEICDVNRDGKIGTLDISELTNLVISSQPSITVLSPNGGEQLEMEKTYQIHWQSQGVNKILIELISGSNGVHIAYLDNNPGLYRWTVPSDLSSLGFDLNTLKISVSDREKDTPIDHSDNYFSIVPPQPEIDIELKQVAKGDFHTYGFLLNICVNGSKSVNDVYSFNPNKIDLTYVVYDSNNVAQKEKNSIIGVILNYKNGQCFNLGVILPSEVFRNTYDQTNQAVFILDYDNLISETNEDNNLQIYSAPQPSITIISPNTEGRFQYGVDMIAISWQTASSSIEKVDIFLMAKEENIGDLLVSNPIAHGVLNTGNYDWRAGITVNRVVHTGESKFKIRIINHSDQTIYADSNAYFSLYE